MQRAPPMKKNMRRQTKDEKALRMTLRGRSVSAAAMAMYSGPTILYTVNMDCRDVKVLVAYVKDA